MIFNRYGEPIETPPPTMRYPMRCTRCGLIRDTATVTVVQRYSDCSTWRCPGCDSLIDDRPVGWGGSAERFDGREWR